MPVRIAVTQGIVLNEPKNVNSNNIEKSQSKEIIQWDNPFDNVATNSLAPDTIPELFVDMRIIQFIAFQNLSLACLRGILAQERHWYLGYVSIDAQSYAAEKNNKIALDFFSQQIKSAPEYTLDYQMQGSIGQTFGVVKDAIKKRGAF